MPEEWLRGEIDRLRDRTHDIEAVLAARHLVLESLRGRTAALEGRLTKVEETVEAMREADKMAKAVASAMQKQHGGILTKRQRWIGYIVALAAVVGAIVQIVNAFT